MRGLNSEIKDLQSEFERDRQDYLDTIRKQDQQLLLIETILDRVQPTVRKDCNYSNIERIKQEAVSIVHYLAVLHGTVAGVERGDPAVAGAGPRGPENQTPASRCAPY